MFKMLKKKLKDQRGLTLIELLAVIVILGIIAAIAIPSIGNIITNSKKDAIRADAKLILNSASLYLTENTLVTGDTVISLDDLTPEYIDGITTIVTGDEYTVHVTAGGLIISGQGTKDGVTLDFGDTATAAGKSLEQIDAVN
jgi:type IV pilus assembly protein PilA